MQVRLLGLVDISGGPPPEVTGQRRRSLLATLAVHAGELVSVDKIVEAVWDGEPPATAHNTVQSHVAYLRRILGDARAIEHRALGYTLRLPAPATDLAVVRSLLVDADQEAEPERRAVVLAQAVAMWRGRALTGVGASSYLERHAVAMEDLRLHARERLYTDRLRLGQHREVADDLRELLVEHPHAELLARLTMVALTRTGRPSEAIATYEQLRRGLRDDLGVATSPATDRLALRVVRGDPSLLVPGGAPAPTRRTPSAGSTSDTTRIIGREAELAQILDDLESGRLVSIVGMGGVGKTRLLHEAAQSLVETGVEVVRVELDGAVSGVCEHLARALRLDVQPDEDLRETVIAALAARSCVLALDGCESAPAEVADVVATVLARTTDIRVLTTTRRPLHVTDEACLFLGPLDVPHSGSTAPYDAPSVVMLCEGARAADRAFRVSARNIGSIAEICRRVGGLPLALEIVGPRLRSLTVHELADSLSHELIDWTLSDTVPERHRSVSAVVGWSYQLLNEDDRAMLDQLSLLRGGAWADELGDLLGSSDAGWADTLERLVDNSLLTTAVHGNRRRVSMHPLVQAYVEDRLHGSGQADAAVRRHAAWTVRRVHDAGARLHGPDENPALEELELLLPNTEAALEWATTSHPLDALSLVADLWWFWFRTGRAREGRAWTERALALWSDGDCPPALHSAAGYLSWVLDDYQGAERHALAALARSPGRHVDTGFADGVLARALGEQGRFAEAAQAARSSVAAYASTGDQWGQAWSGRCLSAALLYDGAVAESDDACREALHIFELVGDTWGVAGGWELAARISAVRGEHTASLALAQMSLQAHRACGDTSGERYVLHQLARTYQALGRLQEAVDHGRQSLELADRHGYRVGALQALLLLVDAHAAMGDDDLSRNCARRAKELAEALGDDAALSQLLASGGPTAAERPGD